MLSKVSLVLALQFGLPFAAAVWLELARSQPRSAWRRLSLAAASAVLLVIPAWAYTFVNGTSPHGESVDWYLMLCLISFGIVPLGVATIIYLAVSAFVEPLFSLVRRKNVLKTSNQFSMSSVRNNQDASFPSRDVSDVTSNL